MSADEFLTLSQVAGRLNIRERIIQRYVDSGQLRAIKIGQQVRYRWRDVDAWVETMQHPADYPASHPVKSRHPTSPNDTVHEVIPLVRGHKRHKVAPQVP